MNKTTIVLGESWPHTRAKTALLAATGEVVRGMGPRGATLKNIAKLAQVTEPAIFRHFDGVDGLFDVLCSVTTMYSTFLINQAKASKNTGLALLEEYFLSKMETITADKEFAAFICQPEPIFADYPDLKKKISAMRAEENKLIASAVKEAKSKGQLLASADPDFVILLYTGLEHSIYNEWQKNINAFNPAKEAAKLWKNFRSLVAKGDAPSARHTPIEPQPYGKEKNTGKAAKTGTAKPSGAKTASKTAGKAVAKPAGKASAKPAAKTTAKAPAKSAKKPAPAKKK